MYESEVQMDKTKGDDPLHAVLSAAILSEALHHPALLYRLKGDWP